MDPAGAAVPSRIANDRRWTALQRISIHTPAAFQAFLATFATGSTSRSIASRRWAAHTSTRKVVRQVKVGKSPHGVWTLGHAGRL